MKNCNGKNCDHDFIPTGNDPWLMGQLNFFNDYQKIKLKEERVKVMLYSGVM